MSDRLKNLRHPTYWMLFLLAFYPAIAFPVFQWRNPKANEMTYYSEFGNVITFQRMEKNYQ